MYTLLVVAVLLALLFDTAAATSPMDPTLPAPSSMETFYPDPDGMLNAICELCGISMDYCVHAFANPQQRAPAFTAETFYTHPEWPQDPFLVPDVDVDVDEPTPEAGLLLPPVPEPDRQPLVDAIVRQLEENATTIQPTTVQIHVEGIYTPGDRIQSAQTGSRRPSHRRQAPRPGGFPCTVTGCNAKPFDRSCDLKRHSKTHLGRNERPHKCSVCGEGFLYPKDRIRHQRTHHQSSSSQTMIYCSVAGCSNTDGFSRRDNLLRHQRKQHPQLFAAA